MLLQSQEILHYAGPILLGAETICRRNFGGKIGLNKIWYRVLVTTRILLVHCDISQSNDHNLLLRIARNIRNLYLLFGIDLSKQAKWEGITSDKFYFAKSKVTGKLFIDVENNYEELRRAKYVDVEREFDADNSDFEPYFGHCIYNLIGKRRPDWERSMRLYSNP